MKDYNDDYKGPEHQAEWYIEEQDRSDGSWHTFYVSKGAKTEVKCPLDLGRLADFPCSRGDADCDVCKADFAEREQEG